MAKYKAYPEYKDSGVEWLGRFQITGKLYPYPDCFPGLSGPDIKRKNCFPYIGIMVLYQNLAEMITIISLQRIYPLISWFNQMIWS